MNARALGAGRGTLSPAGDRSDAGDAQLAVLEARVRALEAERRRIFEDAQREADAVFAQYQMSQLLAAGGTVDALSAAVLAEVARTVGAAEAAIWLAPTGAGQLERVATFVDEPRPAGTGSSAGPSSPASFADVPSAITWATRAGWSGTALPEGRTLGGGGAGSTTGEIGYLAVHAPTDGELAADHARYLSGLRLELAVTLRAAQLRAWLADERAALAAILEGATDAIVAVDRDRRVVRLNAAAAALVGSTGESIGAACFDVLGCTRPDVANRRRPDGTTNGAPASGSLCGPRCPFAEVLAAGRPITGREIEVRHRDGTAIPVAASVSRMPGADGGAVGILRDLRPARSLEIAKTSFVAAVSHELRTPLALVDGYAQSLLHLDLDPATARRHVERIADAAGRLAVLVDEIIDVGELESDALVLRLEPVALDRLVRSHLAERAERSGSRPVALVGPRSLPPVEADVRRIRHVVANLVENAEKHAGPEATIEVRLRRLDPMTVVLTVADSGVGIEAEDREHIFERFYRGGRARTAAAAGSGLGLYLCRRIVEAHRGWIRLDPTVRGTSISVGLPRADLPLSGSSPAGESLP